jgi:hypothetical protein
MTLANLLEDILSDVGGLLEAIWVDRQVTGHE